MSQHTTHHHHHHRQLQLNLASIKPEDDSDDEDVVFLATVPKVQHTPEEYDPECICSTCQLVKKLLAECTCGECREQQTEQVNQGERGQVVQSSENVILHNEISSPNVQPSESSIQNNEPSTSEQINANDQDDDNSRSSTPDYLPRFFDDESDGDSNSDYSEDEDSVGDRNENNDNNESESVDDYGLSRLSTSKSHAGSQYNKNIKVKSRKVNSRKDRIKKGIKQPFVCCSQCRRNLPSERFKGHIRTHADVGFRCVWPNCGFFYSRLQRAKEHVRVDHLQVEQANSAQTNRYLVKLNPRTGETSKVRTRRTSLNIATYNSLPSNSSDSNDNEFANSDADNEEIESNTVPIQVKCPKCEKTFIRKSILLRHYRQIHQKWKPYYCRWPKCHFVSAFDDDVIGHADRTHFKSQNRQKARKYVAKRVETPPRDPVLEQIGKIKFGYEEKRICPQCRRTLLSKYLENHIRSHTNSGFRCTWPNCGFFYSRHQRAKEHVRVAHLQVEQANSAQTNRYLVKVSHKTDETTKIKTNIKQKREENNDVDESGHSSSDDDDETDTTPVKCPKCEKTFTEGHKLLRHYRCAHQQWKPYYCLWPKCNFVSAIKDIVVGHAYRTHFKYQNRQKAQKYAAKKDETPPKDPLLDQIVDKFCLNLRLKAFCPLCERSFPSAYLEIHLRTHKKVGYRCAWSGCGFFYSLLSSAKRHVCVDHLQVEQANSTVTNRHLVKVNPKTGKTKRVTSHQREEDQDNDDDEDSNSNDDDSESN